MEDILLTNILCIPDLYNVVDAKIDNKEITLYNTVTQVHVCAHTHAFMMQMLYCYSCKNIKINQNIVYKPITRL